MDEWMEGRMDGQMLMMWKIVTEVVVAAARWW